MLAAGKMFGSVPVRNFRNVCINGHSLFCFPSSLEILRLFNVYLVLLNRLRSLNFIPKQTKTKSEAFFKSQKAIANVCTSVSCYTEK